MSASDGAALDRAIARTVADLVTAAVTPAATSAARTNARDAAQMLGLEALDQALAACAAHVETRPADVAALADRLERLAAVARDAGDLAPFRDAQAELEALAHELSAEAVLPADADPAAAAASPGGLSVFDVLEDVALAGDNSAAVARRSRLPVPVAAAVRAAIDWLAPPGFAAPVRLHGEPSLLELKLDRIRTDRLYAAHRVIAGAGGNLGPALDGEGWIVRVPSFADWPTYLMLVQGGLRIAVPWHSVLKLRIVATNAAALTDHPLLAALAPPALDVAERPLVLVGHGLKRAYLGADRLIWRQTAAACENEWGSPAAGLRDTVATEEGEVFWVADAARLLADVELPEIATTPPAAEAPALTAADVRPLEVDAAADAPPAPPLAPEPPPSGPAPFTPLAVSEYEPPVLDAPPSPGMPPPATLPAEAPAAPAATPGTQPARRALVADDSITARLLLSRLLEHQGFTVETVSSSVDLMTRLAASSWTVLFTDLELPDGGGPEWLRQVCRFAAARPQPVHVVALIRDGGDLDVARAAGVEETLLKPFARHSLAAILARHGWVAS